MDAEPAAFTIASVAGVTLTKWTTAWAERHPRLPLAFVGAEPSEQAAVLHDGRAHVSFVRLPVEQDGLSVIPLYAETPVVVVPREHPISLFEAVTLADLAGEDRVPESLPIEDAVSLVAAGGGILVLPQSLARLHNRKDVTSRPVTDAPETRIALAWLTERTTPEIEEFVGIVRGRTARSSRSAQAPPEAPAAKQKRKPAKPAPTTSRKSPSRGRRRP